jgi:hypothetical protein
MPGPHAGAEVLKTIAVMPQNAMTSSADPLEQDFTAQTETTRPSSQAH